MGLESVFAAAFLALVLWKARGPDGPATPFRLLPLAGALLIVALAFSANLRDPFLSDDYILVSRAALDWGRTAASFVTPGGDGSYRPLGYLYFNLAHGWAAHDPLRWHIVSLALHLANCALLYLVVWSLWTDWQLALAAALLFGIHGTRPEVVTWTAGSFDLVACGFTLAAALCWARGFRWGVPLLVALAILSKESAYAAPVLLAGLAIASRRPVRWVLGAGGGVAAALMAYRIWLFHGPGGYVDPSTGRPQILSIHFVTAAKALLLRIWTILLFPINWEAQGSRWLIGAGIALSCGALGWALVCGPRISRRVAFSLLAATALCVLPAIHLALIGRSELGSRILYLPGIGFLLLCAHLVRGRPAALAALCLGWGLLLRHDLGAWHRAALRADQVCEAGGGPVTGTLEGVYFFTNGFKECVEMKRERPTASSAPR